MTCGTCSVWVNLADRDEEMNGCPKRCDCVGSLATQVSRDGRANSGGAGATGHCPEKRSFGSHFGMKVVFLSEKVAKLPTPRMS